MKGEKRIYLDWNATARLRPEAQEAMTSALSLPHNASSVHFYGREGRRLIENARAQVAALAGTTPNQIVFNSGATEGNNTVLRHFAGERILVSATEHPSVLEAVPQAARIPVTADGIVDCKALEDLLQREHIALVSVMMVNNETGVIQPLAEIIGLAKNHGALVHCDAVQAAGRMSVAMPGIDFLTLSAHKIGGPQGAGALVLGQCGITPTLLQGGGQEKKARPGTENIAAIAGFGAAADKAASLQDFTVLQTRLESGLRRIAPNVTIHGERAPRVTNTTLFSLPGVDAATLLMAFDLAGVALSNGSACASGTVKDSHVLRAMGVDTAIARAALRVSTGWDTTPDDIERCLEVCEAVYKRLKS